LCPSLFLPSTPRRGSCSFPPEAAATFAQQRRWTCSDSRTIWPRSHLAIRFNYSRPSASIRISATAISPRTPLGIDQEIGSVKLSASYVATVGVHLASVLSPNGYGGADPAFAPYTQFNSAGHAIGGFGPEMVMSTGAHSSYHALQTTVSQNTARMASASKPRTHFPKALMTPAPSRAGFRKSRCDFADLAPGSV